MKNKSFNLMTYRNRTEQSHSGPSVAKEDLSRREGSGCLGVHDTMVVVRTALDDSGLGVRDVLHLIISAPDSHPLY